MGGVLSGYLSDQELWGGVLERVEFRLRGGFASVWSP